MLAGNSRAAPAFSVSRAASFLSTGDIKNVIGPNREPNITTVNGTPGDSSLSALSGNQTFDAAILQFDFVPTGDSVKFEYVFGSDEYNEFVNSHFNDVFAFYVNGKNCAAVGNPPKPVSINTINDGNPVGTTPNSNPSLFRNNDFQNGTAPINTELDGLTVVLTCTATVKKGQTNTMRLAIADASDPNYDSDVFLQAQSLVVVNHPPTASITATDSQGATGTASITITVSGQTSGNHPPTVTITAPANGTQVLQGQSVTFTGTGSDVEDGTLTGTSLQWTSSLNGPIGSGTSFSTSALSEGVHTITLTGTDSKDATGTATITVNVGHATSIGADGGDACALKLGVLVYIGKGVFTSPTTVTVFTTLHPPSDPHLVAGSAHDVGPANVTLGAPIGVGIEYDPAHLPAVVSESQLRLFQLVDGAWQMVPGSGVNTSSHVVFGLVNQMGTYAILGASD